MEFLAQDLILLALNSQTGKIQYAARPALPYGLMGAVVLDLVLHGKLAIENNHLIAADASPTDDVLIDECLEDVCKVRHPQSVRVWIDRWGREYSQFQTMLLENLTVLGVLMSQKERLLWIPVHRYFLSDPFIQLGIAADVRAAVLEGRGLDDRMAALISLVHACGITEGLFTPQEERQAQSEIWAITSGEPVGEAILETIARNQAAARARSSAVRGSSSSAVVGSASAVAGASTSSCSSSSCSGG